MERNLKRLISQYQLTIKSNSGSKMNGMDKLMEWLTQNAPNGGERNTLVHGDFRLDNLIFHPTQNKVMAVIDW
jgi:aminoglycoside phosphotransferase (APT) family kinase protein